MQINTKTDHYYPMKKHIYPHGDDAFTIHRAQGSESYANHTLWPSQSPDLSIIDIL